MKEIKIKEVNETIYHFNAVSGLPVYLWVNPHKESVYMTLTVRYGGYGTEFKVGGTKYTVPSGTAHYLEHIKFKTKDGDVSQRIYDLGLDCNAFTASKQTTYEVYGNENIYEGLKTLLDFVYDNYFTKKIVEDERKIILEEANADKDHPAEQFYRKSCEAVYNNECYKKPTIGTVKDINEITIDDISLVHEYFYRPENMFLVITGKFDPQEMEKKINEFEKDRVFKNIGKAEVIYPKETNKVSNKSFKVKDHKSQTRQGKLFYKFYVSDFKDMKLESIRRSLKILINSNFGNSSDFYEMLRQENLCTYLSSSVNIIKDIGFIGFSFESEEPKKVKKFIEEKMKNLEFDEESLNRMKKYLRGVYILGFDNIFGINSSITNCLITENIPYNDYLKNLDAVSMTSVNKIIKNLDLSNSSYGEIEID